MSGVERMLTEPISKRLWPGLAGAQHDHTTAWGAGPGVRPWPHYRLPGAGRFRAHDGDGVPGVDSACPAGATASPSNEQIRRSERHKDF